MIENTYPVIGMSCEHCARAVTEELTALDGVKDVSVDLSSSAVTVASTTELATGDVRAAVEEAGYELRP